jgi:hypothetical protein
MKNNKKKDQQDDAGPIAPAYQEGSVESVGGRPSGRDESDRSGDGTLTPDVRSRTPEPARDAFVSTEVSDKSTQPGKDPRTRS